MDVFFMPIVWGLLFWGVCEGGVWGVFWALRRGGWRTKDPRWHDLQQGMKVLQYLRFEGLRYYGSWLTDSDPLIRRLLGYTLFHFGLFYGWGFSSGLVLLLGHLVFSVGLLLYSWIFRARGWYTTSLGTGTDRYLYVVTCFFLISYVDTGLLLIGWEMAPPHPMQFLVACPWGSSSSYALFGVDGLSLLFLLLCNFVILFCLFLLDHPFFYGVALRPHPPRCPRWMAWLPMGLWLLWGGWVLWVRRQSSVGWGWVFRARQKSFLNPSMPWRRRNNPLGYDSVQQEHVTLYCLLLAVMQLFLVLFFTTMDIFVFFFAYEGVLVPMGLFIVVFGSRVERKQALFYFCAYTLLGSLPLLYGLFSLWELFGTTNLLGLYLCDIPESTQRLLWVCFFLAFAVKIPMVPLHLWLPEAHVEASTTGSVLLAALLLKLGIYGLVRFNVHLLPLGSVFFRPVAFLVGSLGVVYASLIIFRQLDLKKYIAYTSIVHMNMCVLGLFSGSLGAYASSVFLAFIHGFVSTALFFLVGLLYKRYKDRSVLYLRGLEGDMPITSFFFFIFSLANCSFPGSPGFVGELLLLIGLMEAGNGGVVLLVLVGVFFSLLYSLWFYVRIFWSSPLPVWVPEGGRGSTGGTPVSPRGSLHWRDATLLETGLLGLLAGLTLWFGFFPNFFLELPKLCLHMSSMGL